MHSTRSSSDDRYRVLEVSGSRDELEQVLAELVDVGCLGALESSPVRWKLFFSGDVDDARTLRTLRSAYPRIDARWVEDVEKEDWESALRSSFRGRPLGRRFFVLPTWEAPPATSRSILRIDPEQAFGTGTHESTRLSARSLEREELRGRSVIDIGTGSGILAMVSAMLGAKSVLGLEPDPAAAACARRNVDRNGLASIVGIEAKGFEEFPHLRADVIVANLYAALLLRALPRCQADRVIVSGLLVSELASFEELLPPRFEILDCETEAEWAALTLGQRA
jgi:ribosomal protein L11 methyltransferase